MSTFCFNEDMVDANVRDGDNIGVGVDVCGRIYASAGVVRISVGATSLSRCSRFLYEKCKKNHEDYIMYLQTLN